MIEIVLHGMAFLMLFSVVLGLMAFVAQVAA